MPKNTTTEQLRPQAVKTPRTVEVKLLVPWALVTLFAVIMVAFIGGWFVRSNFDSVITDKVNQQVELLKASGKLDK